MLLGLGAVSGVLLRLVQILFLVLLVRYKFVWAMFLPLHCATGMTRILLGRTPFFHVSSLLVIYFVDTWENTVTTSINCSGGRQPCYPLLGAACTWWQTGEDTEALPLGFTWVSSTGSPSLKNGLVGSVEAFVVPECSPISPAQNFFLHCPTGAVPKSTPQYTSCAPACFWRVGSVTPGNIS